MNAEAVRYPHYRWVVLGIAWLTVVCMWWGQFLIPSLAYQLFPALGLTHMQFTLLFSAPFLLPVFLSIPGGALGDRYGIKLVVAIGVFATGIIGLARAFTSSFEGMFILMFLYGISVASVITNLPKLVGIWFPPRQVGLASGIWCSAMAIGTSIGLLTSPLMGYWKQAFIYTGILILAVAVLWALLARNTPKGVEIRMPPLISGIKRGVRSKNIWLVGIAQFLAYGAFASFWGNLANALESARHTSPETAGAIASLLTWGAVVGHVLIPALSDRVGFRKPFIYSSAVCAALFLFFAWQLAPGTATWLLVPLGGFMLGGLVAILFSLPVEIPEIGHEYVGGASGVMVSLLNLGGFLIPPVVVSSLVAAGTISAYTIGFLAAVIILAAVVLPVIFLIETGARAGAKSSGI